MLKNESYFSNSLCQASFPQSRTLSETNDAIILVLNIHVPRYAISHISGVNASLQVQFRNKLFVSKYLCFYFKLLNPLSYTLNTIITNAYLPTQLIQIAYQTNQQSDRSATKLTNISHRVLEEYHMLLSTQIQYTLKAGIF